jgi:hypothetical protein
MLSHIAEWAVAVLAGGVVAGLVVVAVGAAGGGCCTAGFAAAWRTPLQRPSDMPATMPSARLLGGGCGCRRAWCTICAGALTGPLKCGRPDDVAGDHLPAAG